MMLMLAPGSKAWWRLQQRRRCACSAPAAVLLQRSLLGQAKMRWLRLLQQLYHRLLQPLPVHNWAPRQHRSCAQLWTLPFRWSMRLLQLQRPGVAPLAVLR